MNWRNVDAEAWLLCLEWVADVMNHTAEQSLGWRPPLQLLSGQTIDISIMLMFLFWDIVYCPRYKDQHYVGQIGSEKSSEIRGRFVGFAWDVGHALTFKILTDDTKMVICRSRLRIAKVGENNLKLDAIAGADPERVFIRSAHDVILPTLDMASNPFDTGEESESYNKGRGSIKLPKDGEQHKEAPTTTGNENGERHQKSSNYQQEWGATPRRSNR